MQSKDRWTYKYKKIIIIDKKEKKRERLIINLLYVIIK